MIKLIEIAALLLLGFLLGGWGLLGCIFLAGCVAAG